MGTGECSMEEVSNSAKKSCEKENLLLQVEFPAKIKNSSLVKVPCPICRKMICNFSGRIIIDGVTLHIDYCKKDNIWWLNPRPSEEFYNLLYEQYFYNSPMPEQFGYAGMENDIDRRREKAILNMDDIEKHISHFKNNNFLEIGCATGELLIEAAARGWRSVLGVEVEKRCCEVARNKGLEIICGSFEGISDFTVKFDTIFADNVIEHLLEPEKALLKCGKIQERGDYLILRLPDTSWPGPRLKLIDHTFHFTRESISKLLKKSGYKTTDIFHSGTFYSPDKKNHIDNMTVIAKRL